MSNSFILAAQRTPIGKFLGGLSSVSAPNLAAKSISASLETCGIGVEQVDEVIMGNVLSAGVGQAPARQAALTASIPPTVAAMTINKVCGSGLKAVMLADQAIRLGEANVIVAGGMENMSRSPHLLTDLRTGWKFGDASAVDSMVHDGLTCAVEQCGMGELAEYIADKHDVNRADQDHFAAESHRRACAAASDGKFADETIPITLTIKRQKSTVESDEGPRDDTTVESLSNLRPAFQTDGTVTPGNASQLSDGAAALVVANESIASEVVIPTKARIVASVTSGVLPKDLFIAPVSAIESVLSKAKMTLGDIDLVELNEAFAAQCLACMRPLSLEHEKVNIHGGAIALGHPLGASGARILVTLLHALADRDLQIGLAALCLGGGNAVAMIVERV